MRIMTKLALVAACTVVWSVSGDAQETYRYRYVSLDAAVPSGYAFFNPVAVADDGKVYGNAYRCSSGGCVSSVAVRSGTFVRALQPGVATDANNEGLIGGYLITNARRNLTQAALFRGRQLLRIPRRPDEVTSRVLKLSNTGISLISSETANFTTTYYQRRSTGAVVTLDFGDIFPFYLTLNDRGVVAGYTYTTGYRAYRLRPPAALTLLEPLSTESHAWGLGINSRGEVLGYSFDFSSTERIGFWRGTTFHTRFVEGTPEFPTISNFLLWNEQRLIVITATGGASYLVPRANVRLDLADLTDQLPPYTRIVDVNERGDLVGYGGLTGPDESFLLVREDTGAPAAARSAAWHIASPASSTARHLAVANGLLPADVLASYGGAPRKDQRP